MQRVTPYTPVNGWLARGLLAACVAAPLPAWCAPAGTLAKIRQAGVITLGVREGSVPFSYRGEQQQYLGYSLDLCRHVVNGLQKQLGIGALKVVMLPVTTANRMDKLLDGSIDLECGSSTNNLARQQVVAFGPTIYVGGARVLSRKATAIRSLDDLRGKTVVATVGSSAYARIVELNGMRKLNLTIITGKDHPESFQMLASGRAVAEVNDDVLLASQVANARNPADYTINGQSLSVEPYAFMLRRGDAGFKKAVDAALAELFRSGAMDAIYAKWFLAPIPPAGINLNLPMPPSLRAVIAKPTDSPDPVMYGTTGTAATAAAR